MGPIDLIFYINSSDNNIFNYLNFIALCSGALLILYVLITEPRFYFILPYKAYRLQVISSKAGLSLFDYEWTESNMIHPELVAGLLNAVDKMSLEVLGKGNVQEFNLEKGILIFERGNYISVGLLTSNSSKFLRDSLQNFVKDFEKTYLEELKKEYSNFSAFESAYELIYRHFTYLPRRIEGNDKI